MALFLYDVIHCLLCLLYSDLVIIFNPLSVLELTKFCSIFTIRLYLGLSRAYRVSVMVELIFTFMLTTTMALLSEILHLVAMAMTQTRNCWFTITALIMSHSKCVCELQAHKADTQNATKYRNMQHCSFGKAKMSEQEIWELCRHDYTKHCYWNEKEKSEQKLTQKKWTEWVLDFFLSTFFRCVSICSLIPRSFTSTYQLA